jgi:tRNA pseudouridine55 synthase
MNGILNLNKPSGPTSFDMVRLVKRLTGTRHVGHGGTLDPGASGVLPIMFGQATRIGELLLSATKSYRARVKLGVETDTYDAEGRTVAEADASGITLTDVEGALAPFRGAIAQTPPMYSALKHEGQPLYKLARAGKHVERPPREVQVFRLEALDWAPPYVTLEIDCGHGMYVRSLAHDLGHALGCGAHLAGLERTRVGTFSLEDSVSVEKLFDAAQAHYLSEELHSLDTVCLDLPAAILAEEEERTVRYGQPLPGEEGASPQHDLQPCRAYGPDGYLIALLRYDSPESLWRPWKVFAPEAAEHPAEQAISGATGDEL